MDPTQPQTAAEAAIQYPPVFTRLGPDFMMTNGREYARTGPQNAKGRGMALREFDDADGVTWRVWDTSPDILRGLSLEMQRGWLTFDNGEERRRLSPIPADWIELPAQRLVLLLRVAALWRPRQSGTATPPHPERRLAERRRISERRSGDRRGTDETEQSPPPNVG